MAEQALYICKSCGAQSPTGIGYVVTNGATTFPAPDPGCPGPHLDRKFQVIDWRAGK